MTLLQILLSGSVGAVLVFGLGWVREIVQRRREHRGYLLLVVQEIEANGRALARYREDHGLVHLDECASVRSEVWESVRPRLAHLAHREVLGRLFHYYRTLRYLDHLSRTGGPEDQQCSSLGTTLDILGFAEKDALEKIQQRIPGHPDPARRLLRLLDENAENADDLKDPGEAAR